MKLLFFSKLRHLPITLRILCSGVRRLRCSCWALCVAFCLLCSVVSRADVQSDMLTQLQTIAGLLEYYSQNWESVGIQTYPQYDGGSWEQMVFPAFFKDGSVDGEAYLDLINTSLLQVLQLVQDAHFAEAYTVLQSCLSFIQSTDSHVTSIDGLVSNIEAYFNMTSEDVVSISSTCDNILVEIRNYGSLWDSIRDGDKWKVHDSQMQDAIVRAIMNNDSTVEGLDEHLSNISESAGGAYETLSSIDERLSGFSHDWLTKSQLKDVLDDAEPPPHDEPDDDSGEKEQAERSAEYEWTQAESTSYSNRWELAEWKYTEMLPGNASIVSENPADNPGGTGFSPDDSGIPLFARLVDAPEFGFSIDSSVVEPGDYPVFLSYYNEFRARWARIFHSVWDFIGAFMVFFIARREWKYYMGVGDNSPEVESDAGGIF